MLKVGETAPVLTLEGTKGVFDLEKQKGRWVLVFFYPLDFTFVCPTEVTELSKRIEEFKQLNCEVVGVSVDSVPTHNAWIKSLGGLNYALLSDINKEVSRKYGVLIEDKGHSLRGTFLVDPEGILRYAQVNDNNVGRSVSEILRVLQALKTGNLCPVEWKPGMQDLGKPR